MKNVKLIVSTALILISSNASAGALSRLQHARCENGDGSYLVIDVEKNSLYSQLKELPYLSSEYLDEPSPLDVYRWVPDKLHGFGGLAASQDSRLTGLVTFLFNAQEENALPEQSEMRVHYADLNGITTQEVMNCHLTFRE